MAALKDELGDLLLQVVFHARMAEEAGDFAFDDVAAAISDKMVRRHPHVFGDADCLGRRRRTRRGRRTRRPSGRRAAATPACSTASPSPSRPCCAPPRFRGAPRGSVSTGPMRPRSIAKIAEEVGRDRNRNRIAVATHDRLEDEVGDLLFAPPTSRASSMSNRKPPCAARRRNSSAASAPSRPCAAARGIGRDLDALEALWQEVKRGE